MPKYKEGSDNDVMSTQPFFTSSMDLFLESEHEHSGSRIKKTRKLKNHKLLTSSERDVALDPFKEHHTTSKQTSEKRKKIYELQQLSEVNTEIEQEYAHGEERTRKKNKRASKEMGMLCIHDSEFFDDELIGKKPKTLDQLQSSDDEILTGTHQEHSNAERHSRKKRKSKHATGDVLDDSSSRRDKMREETPGSCETYTCPSGEYYSVHCDEVGEKEECRKKKKNHKSQQVVKESLPVSWEFSEGGQSAEKVKEKKFKARMPNDQQKAENVSLEKSSSGIGKNKSSGFQTMHNGAIDQNFSDLQDSKLDKKRNARNCNAKVNLAAKGANCISDGGISPNETIIKDKTNFTNKQFSRDEESCLSSTQNTNDSFVKKKRKSLGNKGENSVQKTNESCKKNETTEYFRDEEKNTDDSCKEKKCKPFGDNKREKSVLNTNDSYKKKKRRSLSDEENSVQDTMDSCNTKKKRRRESRIEEEKNISYRSSAEAPPSSSESRSKGHEKKRGKQVHSELHTPQKATFPPTATKNSDAAQPTLRCGVREGQNLAKQLCYICGINVHSTQDYKDHLAAVHGKNVFQCSLCGRACSSAEGLTLHHTTSCTGMYVHNRVYHCKRCPMSYRNSQGLWRHKKEEHKIGRAVKDYKCHRCSKFFSRNDHLVHHLAASICAKSETNNDERQPNANPFTCDVCQKEYASKRSLQYHMDTIHNRKQFECRLCGQVFRWSKTLSNHRRKCNQ